MGCDIHGFLEVRKNGKWKVFEENIFPLYGDKKCSAPFQWRSYDMFSFLAGVRNTSHVPHINFTEGFPEDSEYLNEEVEEEWRSYWTEPPVLINTRGKDILEDWNYHSFCHVYLKDLADFDYDKTFLDRRITRQISHSGFNGACVAEKGRGTTKTFREFLGEGFFDMINLMKDIGDTEDVRFIYWFDN